MGLAWKHCLDSQYQRVTPAQLYMVSAVSFTVLLDENNVIIAKKL